MTRTTAAERVLIYRNELLPHSETFILSQAGALRRFAPFFAGLQRVGDGLDLAPHPALLLCGAESHAEKVKRRIFLRTGTAPRFARAIAEQRPRMVHAHFAVDACAVLPVVKALCVPLVVTLHGYDVSCSEETFRRWPTTRAYLRRKEALCEYAWSFLCVSEHVRQRAISLGFPEKKLQVHHIGVRLGAGNEDRQARSRTIVFFAGRLVEKKGCIHLIRAMPQVQHAVPRAQLVIAGDGPLRAMLEREAASRRCNAIFLGRCSHAEIHRWMQRARVLVAPGIEARNGDSDGLPIVLCEAQATGLPAIAFATDAVTEVFPVERRNSLPARGDVVSLAGEIIQHLTDDQAWKQASDAGKRHVKAKFDLATQTQLLEEKYDAVIARSHA